MYQYFRIAYWLRSLLQHTRWKKEKLAGYQNKKFLEIVNYAYAHVPFYREKFRQLGINPRDIRGIQDINKLPIIRREELQRNTNKLISEEFNADKLCKVSTSGSTGRPLVTSITENEDAFRKAKILRANIICGQKPWDKWVVITAPQHEAHTYRLQRYLGIYSPISVSVFDDVASQASKVAKIEPNVLDGYSSSILLLAKEVEKIGIKNIKPRIIIGGAELIDNSSKQYVEKVLGAPFYEEYACVELERLAWQCEERSGYHMDADSVFIQFIDENGEEVAAGETGEIVCTSFFNYAMPFIRYATGDLGKASEETSCSCGIVFPLMKVMEGRKESVVVLPDGRNFSPLAVGDCMCTFQYFSHIYQYRFIQKKIDFFKILVKKKDDSVEDKIMEEELLAHIRRTFKLSELEAKIEVEFVDVIPPDRIGKIRKVVSELRDA